MSAKANSMNAASLRLKVHAKVATVNRKGQVGVAILATTEFWNLGPLPHPKTGDTDRDQKSRGRYPALDRRKDSRDLCEQKS